MAERVKRLTFSKRDFVPSWSGSCKPFPGTSHKGVVKGSSLLLTQIELGDLACPCHGHCAGNHRGCLWTGALQTRELGGVSHEG